jgi:glutamate racemase
MHILIADSGVGGLSVVAYAERYVRTHGAAAPVRLTFANAAPANDYGYNSMPSREVKLASLDRFLTNVAERFAPDIIYLACNTLSVLLPDTAYFVNPAIPVKGIVDTGARLVLDELESDPRRIAMIFGTPTTIDADAYQRLLQARGVAASRIIARACPGLADLISEDREGRRTKSEIVRWVDAAVQMMPRREAPVVACLACTHYGYRKEFFADALSDADVDALVVDPNERAIDDLFASQGGEVGGRIHRHADLELVSRYAIPEPAVQALARFLSGISPRAVAALKRFVQQPDLF